MLYCAASCCLMLLNGTLLFPSFLLLFVLVFFFDGLDRGGVYLSFCAMLWYPLEIVEMGMGGGIYVVIVHFLSSLLYAPST